MLVDFTNQRKAEGGNTYQALLDANHARLRPILMTTIGMVKPKQLIKTKAPPFNIHRSKFKIAFLHLREPLCILPPAISPRYCLNPNEASDPMPFGVRLHYCCHRTMPYKP